MKKLIIFIGIIGMFFISGCTTVYYPVERYSKSSCSYYNLDDIKNYLDNERHNFKTYDDYMSVNYGF